MFYCAVSGISTGDVPDINVDCGVTAEQFPCNGNCSAASITTVGTAYQSICAHCSIWTSFPDSVSLEVATLFECDRYGYGKRVTE